MSLTFAALAALSVHDRLSNAIFATALALNAAVFWLNGRRLSGEPFGAR